MPITRYGVYHNLKESKYSISYEGIEYFFSSKVYLDKFKKELEENRKKYEKFFNRNELNLNIKTLSDISLYKMIEKRGFRVEYKGVNVGWQELKRIATIRLHKNF